MSVNHRGRGTERIRALDWAPSRWGGQARLDHVVEASIDADPSEVRVRGDEGEARFALQRAGGGLGITPGTRDGLARVDRAANRASGGAGM